MTEIELAAWYFNFDRNHRKFKWFFDQYFPSQIWDNLIEARRLENQDEMLSIMNGVWFDLPDGRFNIMENPSGWEEFLALIEL